MIFSDEEMRLMELSGKFIVTNPFSQERTALEKALLGKRYVGNYSVWHAANGDSSVNKNLNPIFEQCDALVNKGLAKWHEHDSGEITEEWLHLWDWMCIYWLFAKYSYQMNSNIYLGNKAEVENAKLYDAYLADFMHLTALPGRAAPSPYLPDKIFAIFHQIHRLFNYTFDFIAGSTQAAADMRSAIWQSIFTCDLHRYYRQLEGDIHVQTTLITGESGTGKELVARAIAYSQYIPFDARQHSFLGTYFQCFHPVQLSALPQSLLESELFGHTAGAFTGATHDRQGYFERCQPYASIFLDEIGDITLETQVKLLRLLQTRQFNKIGDTDLMDFKGKVIAATNVNLSQACQEGRFRQDLLFRLCSDTIRTAPLRTLIDGKEEELKQFTLVLSKRMLNGDDANDFAENSCRWIIEHLGLDYNWPGNVRELEQCLRNLFIRNDYTPSFVTSAPDKPSLEALFADEEMTAEKLMMQYVTAVYQRKGSILATAQATGLNRRTVKKYLEMQLQS